MKNLIGKIAPMNLFRHTGRPRMKPVSIAYSLTHRCNLACKTCGLGRGPDSGAELDTAEWEKVFKSIGRAPFWITVTGGEPFLRDDLMDLCRSMVEHANPAFVTIVTNGLLTDRISLLLPLLAREFPDTRFIANISLDGIGKVHDRIRGATGSFDAALETFHALKRKQPENLLVGFHTTISKHNVSNIKDFIVYARTFAPDSHLFEPAQPRTELKMQGRSVAPPSEHYLELVPALEEAAKASAPAGNANRARLAARALYYDVSSEIAAGKQPGLPCFAGFASAQVSPTGDVWACCVRARPMSNLRESGFCFSRVWRSEAADAERAEIAAGGCRCTMANALLTSIMFHPPATVSMAGRFAAGLLGIG